MRPKLLKKDGTLYWVIRLADPTTQLPVDADSTPTINVYKNGVDTADAVTITKRAATTGIYDCSYNPASEVEGDQYTVEEFATISTNSYEFSWEFAVVEAERGTDSANTTTPPTAAAIATQVRTELTTELGRIDENVSASKTLTAGAITAATFAADAITAAAIAANAIGSSELSDAAVAKIEAALMNEGDGQALIDAIVQAIDAADIDTTLISTLTRDAILDRVLAGNHDTANTVGKFIQDIMADTAVIGTPTLASVSADIGQLTTRLGVPGGTSVADDLTDTKVAALAIQTSVETDLPDTMLAYTQLICRDDAAIETDRSAELAAINNDEGSGAGGYAPQSHSLEEVGAQVGEILSDTSVISTQVIPFLSAIYSDIVTNQGSNLALIPWNSMWNTQVYNQVVAGIVDQGVVTLLNTIDTNVVTTMGLITTVDTVADNILVDTARMDALLEDSGGDRFTSKALEQAPSGSMSSAGYSYKAH